MFSINGQMHLILHRCLIFAVFLFFTAISGHAKVFWDTETGWAYSGYNTVRIPGTTGSRLSLTDDLNSKSVLFWRNEFSIPFKDRHMISVLIAPLTIDADGSTNRDINYNGLIFPAGTELEAKYRFDSYRIRYRYFPEIFNNRVGIGGAGKVRDAAIRLSGGGQTTEKRNTGFVPLFSFLINIPFYNNMSVVVDGDALAAPQGRAEDVLFALSYKARKNISLKIGYRLLEGGADNDDVYTFALVHYMVIGATIKF